MDETGHSGDTEAAGSGNGADSHDRTRLNSPWEAPSPDDVPAWRRPATEIRPFAQRPFPPGRPELPPGHPSGEIKAPPPLPASGPPPSWSDGRSRYADLLKQLEPSGPAPASAPPYPYEGDLDDQRRLPPPSSTQQRASFPAVRPSTPGGARRELPAPFGAPEAARHALEPTPAEGLPRIDPQRPADDQPQARTSYDPSRFPTRLPSGPPTPPTTPTDKFSGFTGRPGSAPSNEQTLTGLPQRVPAEPDVPTVPEPPSVEPTAETPALARIATHLRRGDLLPAEQRQEGFDVNAILEAVRGVAGVRDASLRQTPQGAHSLRLDLSDGADPAEVSRHVARLLQDRMGLDAAMQGGGALVPPSAAPAQRSSLDSGSPLTPARYSPAPAARSEAPQSFGARNEPPPRFTSPPTLSSGLEAAASPPRPAFPQQQPARQESPATTQRLPAPLSPPPFPSVSAAPPAPAPAKAPPPSPAPAPPGLNRPAPYQPPPAPVRSTPEPSVPPAAIPPAATPPTPNQLPRAAAAPQAPARPAVDPLSSDPLGTDPFGVDPLGLGPVLSSDPKSDPKSEPKSEPEKAAEPVQAEAASDRPLEIGDRPGPRVLIENVQVNTSGTEATVQVRLGVGGRTATGETTGPAVENYLLRLCAVATGQAIDELLSHSDHADGPAKCFIEHAASVPFGSTQIAVVVLLLSCGGWVEQLAGSAVVTGDDARPAVVRATLAAVNRRLEALLS